MRHRWLVGASSCARRAEALAGLEPGTELYSVDSDRKHGPFAGTADLVRQIAPVLCVQDPAAVRAHGVELFTLAPELWAPVGLPTEGMPPPGECTTPQRYSRLETLRIAHGLIDLLHAWAATVGHSTVVYDNVELADTTELELLGVAVRRLPAELVQIVVCSTPAGVGEPLAPSLLRHATRVEVPIPKQAGGLCLTSR